MRIILIAALFSFLGFNAQAYNLKLNEVVMTVEVLESPAFFSFPCRSFMGASFCDQQLILEDKVCAKTLKINMNSISCQLSNGSLFEIAKVLQHSKSEDDTNPGVYMYQLDFSYRVKLMSYRTPNGRTEYQIKIQ